MSFELLPPNSVNDRITVDPSNKQRGSGSKGTVDSPEAPCEFCGVPFSLHPHCDTCGYSPCDAKIHGDHHLCKNERLGVCRCCDRYRLTQVSDGDMRRYCRSCLFSWRDGQPG